jgi:hypothetical protein
VPHITLDDDVWPKDGAPARELRSIIQFNIVFDDEHQQEAWFHFVRTLKGKYPHAETLGARLQTFIGEVAPRAV